MTINQAIIPVTDSSAIKALSYNKETQTLFIKFKDSPFYAYPNTDEAIFTAFVNHPKKGSFFHKIKAALSKEHVVLNN